MPTRKSTMELPFIIRIDQRKTDPETRKLIRSHVMKGKNRVKPRKRSQHAPHRQEMPSVKTLNNHDTIWLPDVSRLMSSRFAAISFAAAVEPALIADVLSFSSMSSKAMFLLDECIIPKSAIMEQMWFMPMLSDSAYLHAVCFTIQAYFDGFFARTRSLEDQRRDYLYYSRTVRILQERFSDNEDSIMLSDSTIMTVLALSGHAYTTGDYESAQHHNKGLLKLASMRGLDTFAQNTKLLIEIIRCDLSMAIDRCSIPVFSSNNVPWPLPLGLTGAPIDHNNIPSRPFWDNKNTFANRLQPELVAVLTATSRFCVLANAAAKRDGVKISEEVFLHNMSSIMYPLLHQRFETNSIDEVVRLSLLAFSSPVFLHWNRTELPDHQFVSAYRTALAAFMSARHVVSPQERLWLLMIAAFTMFHEPDSMIWLRPWLQEDIRLCNIFVWDDMRDLLNSFLWMGLVFDKTGEDIFYFVQSEMNSE